jgi:hypothetical protein
MQRLRLDGDVFGGGFRARIAAARRQISQVRDAALIEREAVILPLDHAVGFELADVGPAAIKMLCQWPTG